MSGILYDLKGRMFIDHKSRDWCKLPYPGHSKGCPNYGQKKTCPPAAPFIEQYADLTKPMYFMVTAFSLAAHVERMLALNSGWTDRQARCCLYWQNTVRKELEMEVKLSILQGYGVMYTFCPEAMGVNVIRTLKLLGVAVEVKPQKIVHKVALLCYPLSK